MRYYLVLETEGGTVERELEDIEEALEDFKLLLDSLEFSNGRLTGQKVIKVAIEARTAP